MPDNTLGNKGSLIHLVWASSISFDSPQLAKLIHSAAPPLPHKILQLCGDPMRCRALCRELVSAWKSSRAHSGKRHQGIRISYDLVGFIPVEELLKQKTA